MKSLWSSLLFAFAALIIVSGLMLIGTGIAAAGVKDSSMLLNLLVIAGVTTVLSAICIWWGIKLRGRTNA